MHLLLCDGKKTQQCSSESVNTLTKQDRQHKWQHAISMAKRPTEAEAPSQLSRRKCQISIEVAEVHSNQALTMKDFQAWLQGTPVRRKYAQQLTSLGVPAEVLVASARRERTSAPATRAGNPPAHTWWVGGLAD